MVLDIVSNVSIASGIVITISLSEMPISIDNVICHELRVEFSLFE